MIIKYYLPYFGHYEHSTDLKLQVPYFIYWLITSFTWTTFYLQKWNHCNIMIHYTIWHSVGKHTNLISKHTYF